MKVNGRKKPMSKKCKTFGREVTKENRTKEAQNQTSHYFEQIKGMNIRTL